MMDDVTAKRDRLIELLRGFGSCAVAFSGGLDSSVLARAAVEALGDRTVAVTAVSPSMARREMEDARRVAQQIGIRHEVIESRELDNPEYRRNAADRCYHCKHEVITRIRELADRLDLAVIADGQNADDATDHRPGSRAAGELGVVSPLAECGLTKAQLRTLAQRWELPIWDKPASPCLSSRIVYGVEVTPVRLKMVDRAESLLREQGFTTFRVRYHGDDLARLELPVEELPRLADDGFRERVVEGLRELGFKYVTLDLEGFRSGSLNQVLAPEELEIGRER
jgi:uncharacterized protein